MHSECVFKYSRLSSRNSTLPVPRPCSKSLTKGPGRRSTHNIYQGQQSNREWSFLTVRPLYPNKYSIVFLREPPLLTNTRLLFPSNRVLEIFKPKCSFLCYDHKHGGLPRIFNYSIKTLFAPVTREARSYIFSNSIKKIWKDFS